MKKLYLNFTMTIVALLLLCSCIDGTDGINLKSGVPEGMYLNPVLTFSVPDPTVIKASDGYFYLFATEDIHNVPIFRSKNLFDWKSHGTVFTDETRPTFVTSGGIWAPDISYIDGKYVLHYSMSVWGGEWSCGIGAAVADSPAGPWTDNGKLFISSEIGVQNSIDPFYIEEDGKKYLFWGSFSGIYWTELNDDGLSVKNMSAKQRIAGSAFEGVYIYKKGGYYYMFASIGSCCNGTSSTYRLVVGRSESLLGPYVDKNDVDMLNNGYDVVVGSNERFVGNGHCSEIMTDDEGGEWIMFHGYDARNPQGRNMLMDKVSWVDGWPVIGEDNSPSLMLKKPYFK